MKLLLPLILTLVLSGPSVTVTKLTSGIILPQIKDIYHAWSPDGSRVVYLSGSSNTDQVEDHVLKVIDSDGSNPQTLTATEIFHGSVVKRVTWSPDGSRISFEVSDTEFTSDWSSKIYLINPDGSGLTSPSVPRPNPGESEPPIRDEDHAWSQDGSRIVFMGNGNIWVMDANGENQHEIAHTATAAMDPTWSPDGTHIAYSFSVSELGPWEIFTMKADGSEQTRLTSRPFDINANYPNLKPKWSPDGSKIAFAQFRGFFGEDLFTINVNGSNEIRVTNSDFEDDGEFDWSPDGSKIAFERFPDIYTVEASGGNQTRVTSDEILESGVGEPRWSPDGTKILVRTPGNTEEDPSLYLLNFTSLD